MSTGASASYNYYPPSEVQAYHAGGTYHNSTASTTSAITTAAHPTYMNPATAHPYYDPAAIAIANATGINPNHQSASNAQHHQHQMSGYNKTSVDPTFDANVAAQQSIYTPDAAAIHQQQHQHHNQQQQQQQQQILNQQQQQSQSNQSNVKLNKGKARTTVIRKAGGEVWEDQTLMEWDPAHFRLFVGDLAPEVSDDGLAAAFSKWSSFVKARVVRDKVTTKSKGYGFVSYKDPEDFMKAWKEMNGKYVGSRPIKISKATTKVGIVNIGNKKARSLDDHRKKKLIQGVERLRTGAGAVWKNDNRPYARR